MRCQDNVGVIEGRTSGVQGAPGGSRGAPTIPETKVNVTAS